MPSLLGRLFDISLRTELLIMHCLGLVNSVLDWEPIKWTNQLEQIRNLSLSQGSFIVQTIGEDTIKTVLSWIVITRIVSAHVYTITYLTNFYPIVTWRQPILLLPWLIASFVKNLVLEVIVIVIGLLLWYEHKFSLLLFLEFIFVKYIPLILAAYNWYSNYCLFFRLRHIETMQKLRRTMRSDSNLITSRLFAKIDDSKYRTRSLTTLISCESYETYDTQDTISRIIEDPNLSPAEKATRILGLTEQDFAEARIRIKERAIRRRLTEKEDDVLDYDKPDSSRFFLFGNDNEDERDSLKKSEEDKAIASILENNQDKEDYSENEISTDKNDRNTPENRVRIRKKENTEPAEARRKKQMKLSSSCHIEDLKSCVLRKREARKHSFSKSSKRIVDKSCSPLKMEPTFNCDCVFSDSSSKELGKLCCMMNDMNLRTSTPTKDPFCAEKQEVHRIEDSENLNESLDESYVNAYDYNLMNLDPNSKAANSLPLVEKLFNNILLRNLQESRERGTEKLLMLQEAENQLIAADTSQNLSEYHNTLVSLKRLLETTDDYNIDNDDNQHAKIEECAIVEENQNESKKVVVDPVSSVKDDENDTLESNAQTSKEDAVEAPQKVDFIEPTTDETKIRKLYQDSMKFFDGCYEKDFANNSELQCLIQQMEKKQWNLFAGQTNLETLPSITFLNRDEPVHRFRHSEIDDLREPYVFTCNIEKLERYEDQVSSPLNINQKEDILICQKIKVINEIHESAPISPLYTLDFANQMKHVQTQTDSDVTEKVSSQSLLDPRRRKKPSLKSKRPKDQSSSVSPIRGSNSRLHKPRSRSSLRADEFPLRADHSRATLGLQKSSIQIDRVRKPPSLTKSMSDQSMCECKLQKMQAKFSSSTDSKFNGNKSNQAPKEKPKIESFGTLPFSQVAHGAGIETMVFRRKPPVYPKKIKDEVSVSRKPSLTKKEVGQSRRSIEKQSSSNDWKKLKMKNRLESLEEKEARELRALKAYNEVTLMKDKKELEEKLSLRRNLDVISEERNHWRQDNSNRTKKDDYVNKENYFAESTHETDTIPSSSKDVKVSLTAQSLNTPAEKHTCLNLIKINKVTDKLLDNFDRLRGSQTKQELKKGKPIVNTDARKQHTKYSKTKRSSEEENVSSSSSKKLEGLQQGRELDKVQAKEDIREQTSPRIVSVVDEISRVEPQRSETNIVDTEDRSEEAGSLVASKSPEVQEEKVVTMIKSNVHLDIAATWSSSTVNEGDRLQIQVEGFPPTIEVPIEIVTIQADAKNPEEIIVPTTPPIDVESLDAKQDTLISSKTEKPKRKIEGKRLRGLQANIDVTSYRNGVVLTNTLAQGSKVTRDIVDNRTARLLHNAFSYKSMESLVDISSEDLSFDENSSHQLDTASNEFVSRLRNELIISRQEDLDDVCVVAMDHEDPRVNTEVEMSGLDDFEDTGSEIFFLDSRGFDLNVLGLKLEMFQRLLNNEGECSQQILVVEDVEEEEVLAEEKEEHDEVEEEELDETTLEFIKEDAFTNIKFPIVIKLSDFSSDNLRSKNSPEVLNTLSKYTSLIGKNSGSFDESAHEKSKKYNELFEGQNAQRFEQFTVLTASEFVHEFSSGNNVTHDNSLEYQSLSTDLEQEPDTSGNETFVSAKAVESGLNKTFDVSRETADTGNTCMEESINYTTKEIEYSDESESSIRTDELEQHFTANTQDDETYNSMELSVFDDEENIIIFDGTVERNDVTFVISKENLTLDIDEARRNDFSEVKDEISVKIVLIFCIVVLFFYVRFFYQKIWSFARVSRSTMTVRPFEIHALPPTTTFFERIEVDNSIEDSVENESSDLEEVMIYSESFGERLSRTFDIEQRDSFDEIKEQVRETLLGIRNIVSENTEDDKAMSYNKSRSEKQGIMLYENCEDGEESQKYVVSSRSEQLIEEGVVNKLSSNSFEIISINGPSVLQSDDRGVWELNLVRREIEGFRYEELDHSDSSQSLLQKDEVENDQSVYFDAAEAEMETSGTGVEGIEKNDTERELNPSHILDETEEFHESSKAEETISSYKSALAESDAAENVERKNTLKNNDGIEPRFFESNAQEVDSFDSAYTRVSEMLENNNSAGDLNASSMEDFSINSNASNET